MAEGTPKNIWGQNGCLLPDGQNLCDACCTVKPINSPWGEGGGKRFVKPEVTPCEFMARPSKKGQGCLVNGMAPKACEIYHCSMDNPAVKQYLIAQALVDGLVSPEEAATAMKNLQLE